MNTAEYAKKLKHLIKQYHPDTCLDERLKPRYNEITRKLTGILNSLKTKENRPPVFESPGLEIQNDENNKLSRVQEQDYAYYKLGVRYYKNIHPDRLYKKNPDKTWRTKSHEELAAALNNIFLSFNLAEYYFNKVLVDHPDSPWFWDAKRKVKLLKKLYKSYESISAEENQTLSYEKFLKETGLRMM